MMSSDEELLDEELLDEKVFICTSPDTLVAAEEASNALILPETSKERYEAVYHAFMEWRRMKQKVSFSENVFLSYFSELCQKYKPSSIWSKYSMLRSMVKIQNDVDISQYSKLLSFIKQNAKGFKSKKAKVLTSNQIEEFLNKAPNEKYLALKVILIFGVTGACRTCELVNMKVTNVEDHGNMYLVKIPETKTNMERSFTIAGKYYDVVRQYRLLRPAKSLSDRFFVCYRDKKCTSQVIGKNTFSQTPRKIAEFLNLPEPDRYTGHCFRRTSTTLLAHAGGGILQIKRHGSCRSSSIAECYIADSINHKEETGDLFTSEVNLELDSKTDILNLVPNNEVENTAPALMEVTAVPHKSPNSTAACESSLTVENTNNFIAVDVAEEDPLSTVPCTNTNNSIKVDEINISGRNIVFEEATSQNNARQFNFTNCNVTINYGKMN